MFSLAPGCLVKEFRIQFFSCQNVTLAVSQGGLTASTSAVMLAAVTPIVSFLSQIPSLAF